MKFILFLKCKFKRNIFGIKCKLKPTKDVITLSSDEIERHQTTPTHIYCFLLIFILFYSISTEKTKSFYIFLLSMFASAYLPCSLALVFKHRKSILHNRNVVFEEQHLIAFVWKLFIRSFCRVYIVNVHEITFYSIDNVKPLVNNYTKDKHRATGQ